MEEEKQKLVEDVSRIIFKNRNLSDFNSVFFRASLEGDIPRLEVVFDTLRKCGLHNLFDLCRELTQSNETPLGKLREQMLVEDFVEMQSKAWVTPD